MERDSLLQMKVFRREEGEGEEKGFTLRERLMSSRERGDWESDLGLEGQWREENRRVPPPMKRKREESRR